MANAGTEYRILEVAEVERAERGILRIGSSSKHVYTLRLRDAPACRDAQPALFGA